MKISNCPVCKSDIISDAYMKNGFSFSQCKNCDVIFQNPQPTFEQLSNDIYAGKTGYHTKLESNLEKIKKYKKRFTMVLDEFKKLKLSGSLLDVACSNGEFMFMAKNRGFNVEGVELNRDSAKVARKNGFKVFDGTLESARFDDDSFAVIHLGGVVEVVSDPVGLLKECKRILRKGGIVAISNVNSDSFWGNITKKSHQWLGLPWSLLVPHYRLFLFTDVQFQKLLGQLGFEVLKTKYYNGFLRHELGGTGALQKFFKKKSLYNLLSMVAIFSFYTVLHFITLLVSPFSKKKLGTIVFVRKPN